MPSEERRREIEDIVSSIILNHTELNVPAFDIIKYLKEKEGFAIASKPMIDDTTGMLFVNDEEFVDDTDTHKLIVINSLLKEQGNFIQRRRFIIAHEFGHYVLHKKDAIQYAHRDTSNKDALEEKEADYFARCLLMPKDIIDVLLEIKFIKDSSEENKISLISRIFNVTRKKAKQRIKEDLRCDALLS